MSLQFFSSALLAATPWKNGGGTTQEVVCWPQGASLDSFVWRISIAQIASSGPFSAFAGIDRVITLLSGDGVHLHTPDGQIDHHLGEALQPFAFSGDIALDCDVLGNSPSQDFNVMTRRGVVQAQVSIHRGGQVTLQAPHGLLLARAGTWQLPHGNLDTAAQDGVYWTAQAGQTIEAQALTNDAVLIAVALREVAQGA